MSSVTVLIVEDDRDVADILTLTVNRLGYTAVGSEETGERAVGTAEKLKPDVVLMDINLSGKMDGIEAGRRIGEELRIPVIFVTAMVDDKTLERVAGSTSYGFIVKPFRDEELRAVIDIAVNAKK